MDFGFFFILAAFTVALYMPLVNIAIWKGICFWRNQNPLLVYALITLGAIVFLLLIINSQNVWGPYAIIMPLPVIFLGWGFALGAFLLDQWCQHLMGFQTRIMLSHLDSRFRIRLVTGGPYSVVRHPMYGVGAPLFILGAFLSTGTLALLPALFFFYPVMYLISGVEEERLLEIFGDDYLEYAKKVPRMFPKIGFGR